MPVVKKDVVKEIRIYSDGTVEDTTVARKEQKSLFGAPGLPDWAPKALGIIGLVALAGVAYYMLVQKKPLSQLPADVSAGVSGLIQPKVAVSAPKAYKFMSPVPQPMVTIDEFAMPLHFPGRSIG